MLCSSFHKCNSGYATVLYRYFFFQTNSLLTPSLSSKINCEMVSNPLIAPHTSWHISSRTISPLILKESVRRNCHNNSEKYYFAELIMLCIVNQAAASTKQPICLILFRLLSTWGIICDGLHGPKL